MYSEAYWQSHNLVRFSIGMILVLLLNACANIVSPEGGPRDLKAPTVLSSEPPDKSVNFTAKQIRITFDEFIAVKDISSQLFISPPLKESADVRLKGRSMLITLPDSLNANTTYTLYFGSAIRDITEGNILQGFTFSFSTGATRDSLILQGQIVDAYTAEAVDGALICLYKEDIDSLFATRPPDYITRSGADGSFTVYNLPQQEFRIYALMDANSNSIFDLPNEAIAFDTAIFRPAIPPPPPADSTDSLSFAKLTGDSLLSDSLISPQGEIQATTKPGIIRLRLFSSQDTTQLLKSAKVPRPGLVRLEFSRALQDFGIRALDTLLTEPWKIEEPGQTKDTISIWLLQKVLDSIRFEVRDAMFKDTISLSMKERKLSRQPKRQQSTAKPTHKFKPGSNIRKAFNPEKQVTIYSTYPIDTVVLSSIIIRGGGDTVQAAAELKGPARRQLVILNNFLPDTDYEIICDDSALVNILGQFSDSVAFRLKTMKADDLGSLSFQLQGLNSSYWVAELLDAKDKVSRRSTIAKDGECVFLSLEAGKYRLRIYEDLNQNRRWDPGYFERRIQPEKLLYYPLELNVRAKWELKEIWEVE